MTFCRFAMIAIALTGMTQAQVPPDLDKTKRELEIQALRERTPLEVAKLNLEIEALKKRFRETLTISIITAAVAVVIAGGGWFIDRRKTREANLDSAVKRQEERLSKTLENFGSANLVTRMAAVSDLSSFARAEGPNRQQIISALVNRLGVTEDIGEMESVVGALAGIGRPALSESVNANRRAALTFSRACGRYTGATETSHENSADAMIASAANSSFLDSIARILDGVETPYDFERVVRRMSTTSTRAVLQERVFEDFYRRELGFWAAQAPMRSAMQLDSIVATQKDMIQKWQYLYATSLTISRILRQLSGSVGGVDISGTLLVVGDLRNLDLRGIVFKNGGIVARNLENTDLSCSDLSYTSLQSVFFSNLKLRGASLRGTRLPALDTDNAGGGKADLSGSNWEEAIWVDRDEKGTVRRMSAPPNWVAEELEKAKQANPYSATECKQPKQ